MFQAVPLQQIKQPVKQVTNNEYHQKINHAVEYIDTHLKENITLKFLAQEVNISAFHFHRIFKAYIGETLALYIARLRLEKAAQSLQYTNKPLEKIARKTGYNSQYSLSKAFKKHFGSSPSSYRKKYSKKRTAKTYSPLKLVPELRYIESQQLVYIRIKDIYGAENAYRLAWKKLWKFSKKKKLLSAQSAFLGLNYDDPNITENQICRFYACISTQRNIPPEAEFGTLAIPAGDFAVFTLKGAYSGLNNLYQYIYLQWLPQSKITLRNSIPFEKYLNNPDLVSEEEILTEVFIPIK